MKKQAIDLAAPVSLQLAAVKDNIDKITGRSGGQIATLKGIASPSVGIDVATGAGTLVTKKSEFDQMVIRVLDLEAVVRALVARLNTP